VLLSSLLERKGMQKSKNSKKEKNLFTITIDYRIITSIFATVIILWLLLWGWFFRNKREENKGLINHIRQIVNYLYNYNKEGGERWTAR